MRLSNLLIYGATAAAMSFSPIFATAQPAAASGPGKPPAEAIAACKSATAGSECNFTGPRGPQKGTCWAPEGKPLACKPAKAAHGAPNSKPSGK